MVYALFYKARLHPLVRWYKNVGAFLCHTKALGRIHTPGSKRQFYSHRDRSAS